MILPGRQLIPHIIRQVRSANQQKQPCGVDLTLRRVKQWTSPGRIDFDNTKRITASTEEISFMKYETLLKQADFPSYLASNDGSAAGDKQILENHAAIMLKPGAYLVDFNETAEIPLNCMGQVFVRSSLFRSGVSLSAGVMDSGYKGAIGALLQVVNPHGLLIFRHARMAQIVFHQMSEAVEGYSGKYQGSDSV